LLKNVFRFIEANYADDLKVERIAREVALSPSRLIHRMRSQYGLTLGDCVVKVRMEKAQTLLRNTDMPIGRIAHGGRLSGSELLHQGLQEKHTLHTQGV